MREAMPTCCWPRDESDSEPSIIAGRARRPPVSPDCAGPEDHSGRRSCRAVGVVAAMTPCGHRSGALIHGSRVDNYLAQVGTRSPAGILIRPGNWGRAARVSPATSQAPPRHPAYFHSSPATFLHSRLNSSSRRCWRDRSVLSRQPRQSCCGCRSATPPPPSRTRLAH